MVRSVEQRARDRRLAWIIVVICGVVTLSLLVSAMALSRGPVLRWAADAQAQSQATADTPADGKQGAGAAPAVIVQPVAAPTPRSGKPEAGAAQEPPTSGPVLQKQSAEDERVLGKAPARRGAEDSATRNGHEDDGDEDPQRTAANRI